ncbi:M15 family metallopeptidase [Pararhizobium qamdonense]|uniref:M15 family metallopeptidase n=1 Tax=Pararhizobium qamdonense TaxID=3031126 RepID=UPI0023E1FE4A|nr:M15 family metallopeptidase [Pararhizobium qamdonense]
MATVPIYQRTERLRPNNQQGITTQATADDFGAAVGRGMGAVAQGLDNAGTAFAQVNALKDESLVRQRRNALMEEKRALMNDPSTGYLNQAGQNALDQRADFEGKLKGLRTKYAEGLSPSQQQLFDRTIDPIENDGLDSIVRHAGGALKDQIVNDAQASANNFMNEALVNSEDPAKADKYIAAGLLEIRNLGQKQGWTADMLDEKERQYTSDATQRMALQIATKSPLAAQDYITKNAKRLSANDKFELDVKLKPIVQEAESDAKAAEALKLGRAQVDVVQEVVDAAEGGGTGPRPSQTGRRLEAAGPSRTRALLISKAPGKGAAAVDGLDEGFATNLAALIEDAPPAIRDGLQIMSGERTHERQKQLFAASDRTGRTVARPGHSNHEPRADGTAKAVDLAWNGQTLKPGKVPQNVIDYVHANAGRYGMYFPMGYEPWHVEPNGTRGTKGTTVASKVDGPVSRSSAPSFDQIQTFLGTIDDPVVRSKTEAKIFQSLDQQDKIRQLNQKGAREQLWEMWQRDGTTPDQAPVDLRIAAGNTAVDSIQESIQKEQEGRAVTDQNVLFSLNRMAAESPEVFKTMDLTDYYSDLSRADRKAVTDDQNKLLSGDVQAQQTGATYNAAYKQAEQALSSVGLTTTGITSSNTAKVQEMQARIATFQNSLKMEIDQFRTQKGTTPNYDETQSLINALLMKSIYSEPRGSYSPMRLFDDGTSQTDGGFMFERGNAPDGATVKPAVEYQQIPPEWQASIKTALTERTGKAPTKQEIEAEYASVVMEILGQN